MCSEIWKRGKQKDLAEQYTTHLNSMNVKLNEGEISKWKESKIPGIKCKEKEFDHAKHLVEIEYFNLKSAEENSKQQYSNWGLN